MNDIHIHIHFHSDDDRQPEIEIDRNEDLDEDSPAERLSHAIDSVHAVIDRIEDIELYATNRRKFIGFRSLEGRRLGYSRVTTGRFFINGVSIDDVAHLTQHARQLTNGVAMWSEQAPTDEIVAVLHFAREH